MSRQFLCLLGFTLLITWAAATALAPLVCEDEADAHALIHAARPHDAQMHYFFSSYTDAQLSSSLQRYGLVRDLTNTSTLDIRRYCWPPAWRTDESIIAWDAGTGINCTALSVNATTAPPMELILLFHVLTCYQDLIVGDLCTDPNSQPIFMGTSSAGIPVYVHGCAPGKVCSDASPDEGLFIWAVVAGSLAYAVTIVAIFASIYIMRKHVTQKSYELLSFRDVSVSGK
jgi:hypothetical protein